MPRFKSKEPIINCFAYYKERNICRALNELVCTYQEKCPFYKHKSEINYADIERAISRYTGPK